MSGWPQALKQVSGKTSKALCDNPDSDFIGSSSEEDEIEAGGVLVPQPPVRVGMAVIAEESHVLKDICPNEAHEEICRELLRHRWKKLSEEEGLDVENFPSLDATSERSLASLMGDFIERLIRGTMILAKKYMQAKKDSSADTLSSTFIIQTARVLNAPERYTPPINRYHFLF